MVRDQALLDQISQAAKSHYLAALPTGPQAERYRLMLADPQFQIFYHAPVLVVISGTAQGGRIVEDCALAAENLMLSAHGLGLGTCWIGFSQGYLNAAEGKQALGIPETWVPVAPIIVGHPKTVPAPVARKEPEVRWVG